MIYRYLINVAGIVQGVGFRPYIFRLANRFQLSGFVKNNSDGVLIEVEGKEQDLHHFVNTLNVQPPPLAQITQLDIQEIQKREDKLFRIKQSKSSSQKKTLISPDISTCEDCRRELMNPQDRRYLYPFINCTNCGPRYTIISDIPYDRACTSMASFTMCKLCQKEYEDPHDRRFHAQPNACPDCGPSLTFIGKGNIEIKDNPIGKLIEALNAGQIAAIKGIGGFHLAVDAKNSLAVRRLRERKHRFEKPLALMVRDIETAKKYVRVNTATETLLNSLHRPIVLCERLENGLAAEISFDNDFYGIMLPYSPLHELIFNSGDLDALIMTSANISEDPICFENQECLDRMSQIADSYLMHDRGIYLRCDDSVLQLMDDRPLFLRRSRGYSPRPIILSKKGQSVLAVGGHLKNTVCLTKDHFAFISQHIGDLENLETLKAFEHTIDHLQKIFQIEPEAVIHDRHPEYLSTKWVQDTIDVPVKSVQHHYAHILSVMAENAIEEDIIGIALDGSGYGEDGKIWGGEVLISNLRTFKRVAHFEYLPMPGGEKAILEPWRMCTSYLFKYLKNGVEKAEKLFTGQSSKLKLVEQVIEKKINSPDTSSCGRLFDAVAAILGLRETVAYEGQAAIMLESLTKKASADNRMLGKFELIKKDNIQVISPNKIIQNIVELKEKGKEIAEISHAFHLALVDVFLEIAECLRSETGINQIALSGGCFQNMFLLKHLADGLSENDFQVLTNKEVPVNDGGISLGQAYWGMHNA
jgi:hydrogenase maturation protein HypF